MELIRAPLPHDLLQQVIDKAKDGFTMALSQPVSLAPLNNLCWMIKPGSRQEEDIVNIRAEQKAKYIAHLQAEHARYQDMLRQQLIQAAEEEERKAAEAAKAKQLVSIEKRFKLATNRWSFRSDNLGSLTMDIQDASYWLTLVGSFLCIKKSRLIR